MRFYSLVRRPLTETRHLDWLMLLLMGIVIATGVSHAAGVHSMITPLMDGYDTRIGDRGAGRLPSVRVLAVEATGFGEIATGENISPAKPPLSERAQHAFVVNLSNDENWLLTSDILADALSAFAPHFLERELQGFYELVPTQTSEKRSGHEKGEREAIHPIFSALGALLAIILAFKLIFYGRERGNYLGAAISLCGFPFIYGFMHFVLHGIFGLPFP
jgi:hypothetical protein